MLNMRFDATARDSAKLRVGINERGCRSPGRKGRGIWGWLALAAAAISRAQH